MKLNKKGANGKILNERKLYQGPIFDLVQQKIKTPDNLTVDRDLIRHTPAVNILAISSNHQVILNQEYRVGVNQEVIALPAGLIDNGETAIEAAQRELQEETGYQAKKVKIMSTLTSSDGFTTEKVSLALVKFDPQNRGKHHFDYDEFITNDLVPFSEVLKMVKDGRIFSAHSVASILYFNNFERDF